MAHNTVVLLVIALIVILFFASVFSALETAAVTVTEHKLIVLQDKHVWARYAYLLKRQLDKVLIFSLFGNSLFNVIFTTITTLLIADLLKNITAEFILPIVTLLITFFIVIFSEVIPKIIAAKLPVATLKLIAVPLYYTFILATPFVWVIDKIVAFATFFIKFSGISVTSAAELKALINDSKSPFSSQHRTILVNSLDLETLIVKDVLIPLRLVTLIDIDMNINSTQKKIYHTHHARIIVIQGNIDNIIGFIHVRDCLALEKNSLTREHIMQLLRPISFVPDFMPLIKQIEYAERHMQRIFVVVNEYGDISGVACLADMFATVVGDFTTKSPRQRNLVTLKDKNQLIVDGTMLLRELNKLYNLDIAEEENVLTVNGMVLNTLNGIPNVGVCFKKDQLIFEVINVGQYWVERVKITMPPQHQV